MKPKQIKDSDVFAVPIYKDCEIYQIRNTVKMIIKNKKDEIALITNDTHGCFLLPGGGAESKELEKEAIREALEEAGCHIQIIGKIAESEELRNRNAKRYQTTCFLCHFVDFHEKDLRTEDEKLHNLQVFWFPLDEALKIMSNQVEKVSRNEIDFYNTSFNIVRDGYFLNMYYKSFSQN